MPTLPPPERRARRPVTPACCSWPGVGEPAQVAADAEGLPRLVAELSVGA